MKHRQGIILIDYPSYPLNMPDVSFTYDIADRLVSMTQGNNTTTWDYNEAYELVALSTPQGGLEYEYDNLGRLWKLIKNTTQVTEYGYDDASRLVSILNPYNELTEFEYDDDSKLIRKLFANGTKEEYSYDERNRLLGIVLKKSNNDVLSSHQYVYDAVSNVIARDDNGTVTEFAYDLIDQLLTETKQGYSAEYTYDANGNRLTRTVNNVTEDYEYDDADKLLSVSINENPVKEYTYDACGRLIEVESSAGTTYLQWDIRNRLTQIAYPNSSTNTFSYNGFGARISKSDSTGNYTFFRSGTSVVSPVLSDGSATYTPGISERRNNNSTFYHSDLKNTTTQTNSSETVSGTNQYDAFGNLIDYTGNWNGPFSYGGKFGYQSDDDSGLTLLGHRYYDSSTGRFISRDPIGKGKNWYSYCGNNPLNKMDFIGLSGIGLTDGGLAIPVVDGEGGVIPATPRPYMVMSRVQLRFKGWHTYVVVIDEFFDTKWAIRGGPQYPLGFGNVKVDSGEFNEDFPDWEDDWEINHPCQTLYVGSIPASVWVDTFNNIAKKIDNNIEYVLLGPNSNTLSKVLLEENGFEGIQPNHVAPGWNAKWKNSTADIDWLQPYEY